MTATTAVEAQELCVAVGTAAVAMVFVALTTVISALVEVPPMVCHH